MAFGLLKYGLSRRRPVKRFLGSRPELRPSYDVAIIGGGGHGLATAYYLAARHGVRNIAVFDKGWHRRRQHRAQHGHHPLQLPDAGGRALLRGIDAALSRPQRGARLQHPLFRARALHAGALGFRHAHLALAGRGEQASRRRFRGGGARGAGPAGAAAQPLRRGAPPGPRRPLPPARRHRPPRRGRLGLCRTRAGAGRRDPPGDRGDRHRHRGRAPDRAGDQPGQHRLRQGGAGGRRAERPGRAARGLHPADPHRASAGLRLAAAQALPRPDHRLGQPARLHLAVPTGASW